MQESSSESIQSLLFNAGSEVVETGIFSCQCEVRYQEEHEVRQVLQS